QEKYITGSQFRSYDFVPRVAQLILSNIQPISKLIPIDNIPDAPECVWWIDNFGNCKTTLLFDELKIVENNKVKTKFGLFPYFEHLNDVPRNSSAFVRGSSGIGGQRFIEFLTQGQNTAEIFNIKTGDNIFA
ncbi:hypothetical protein ISS03_03605, partial [Patescibacteria group bacterium]|nr:hypothetical protein [Patescibacteria group bacterium]